MADLLRQIFVLSAVSPEKMSLVVQNVQKVLKVRIFMISARFLRHLISILFHS